MPKKNKWSPIPNSNVRHIWVCDTESCPKKAKKITVVPTFYAMSGTPVCEECEQDMVYIITEIADND